MDTHEIIILFVCLVVVIIVIGVGVYYYTSHHDTSTPHDTSTHTTSPKKPDILFNTVGCVEANGNKTFNTGWYSNGNGGFVSENSMYIMKPVGDGFNICTKDEKCGTYTRKGYVSYSATNHKLPEEGHHVIIWDTNKHGLMCTLTLVHN